MSSTFLALCTVIFRRGDTSARRAIRRSGNGMVIKISIGSLMSCLSGYQVITSARQVAIPPARYSLEVTWVGWVYFNLFTQAADELGQAVVADSTPINPVFGPDGADQIILRADLARVVEQ